MIIGLNTFFSIVILIINILALVYIRNLEKIGCECSEDWRKTYAFVYLILSIIYTGVAILAFVTSRTSISIPLLETFNNIIMLGSTLMAIAGILYIVFSLQYINKLKEIKCKCSQHIIRDIWEVLLYIYVVFIIFGFILGLVVFFTGKDYISNTEFNEVGKNLYSPLSKNKSGSVMQPKKNDTK